MSRVDEKDKAIAEVTARLKNYSLSTCLDCGGQGYTDMGKSACFWCRGAGVVTQQMAYAFGVADRAAAPDDRGPCEALDDAARISKLLADNTLALQAEIKARISARRELLTLKVGVYEIIASCDQDARDQDHNATQKRFGGYSKAYAEGRGAACRGVATRLRALLPETP